MRKLIDISDESITAIKYLAVGSNKAVKTYIQDLVETEARHGKLNELAKHMIKDGQYDRALSNYLTRTFEEVKSIPDSFTEQVFNNDLEFWTKIKNIGEWQLQLIEDNKLFDND